MPEKKRKKQKKKQKKMIIRLSAGCVTIDLPSANAGKYRLKTRDENIAFGAGFSGRNDPFHDGVYLEWQIGYDAEVKAVEKGDKYTALKTKTFIGANGKETYVYELAEILYFAATVDVVSLDKITALINEIKAYDEFIDTKEISIEKHDDVQLNGLHFAETSIKLPTLYMSQNDGTQLEASIQKQERALGFQPMIYLSIPFKSFINCEDFRGRASKRGEFFSYSITAKNIETVFNLFRVFGMASAKHKQDTERILDVIIELLEEKE